MAVALFGTKIEDGTEIVSTSSNGSVWTQHSTPIDAWTSVAFGSGVFVIVSATASCATSPDGSAWTVHTLAVGTSWGTVMYAQGLFVSVAESGTTGQRVMTSPDGVLWNYYTPSGESDGDSWLGLAYGSGLYVSVGEATVLTSSDVISWTVTSAVNSEWAALAYGNGVLVDVA